MHPTVTPAGSHSKVTHLLLHPLHQRTGETEASSSSSKQEVDLPLLRQHGPVQHIQGGRYWGLTQVPLLPVRVGGHYLYQCWSIEVVVIIKTTEPAPVWGQEGCQFCVHFTAEGCPAMVWGTLCLDQMSFCPSVLLVTSGSEVSLKIQVERGARVNQVSKIGVRRDWWNLPLVFTDIKMWFNVTLVGFSLFPFWKTVWSTLSVLLLNLTIGDPI